MSATGPGRPNKYDDFVVSAPYLKAAKYLPSSDDEQRNYVTLTCPHCQAVFKELLEANLAGHKADYCIKHLRMCTAAKDAGVHVPPPKRRLADKGAGQSTEPDASTRIVPLETALTASNAELVETRAANAQLTASNAQLNEKVQALTLQVGQLLGEMQDLRARVSDLEQFRADVVEALDVQTPPSPTTTRCVGAIKARDADNARLRRLRNKANQERDDAIAERDDAIAERDDERERRKKGDAFRRAFRTLAGHAKFDKALRVVTHTDNRQTMYRTPEQRAAAALLADELLRAQQRPAQPAAWAW